MTAKYRLIDYGKGDKQLLIATDGDWTNVTAMLGTLGGDARYQLRWLDHRLKHSFAPLTTDFDENGHAIS